MLYRFPVIRVYQFAEQPIAKRIALSSGAKPEPATKEHGEVPRLSIMAFLGTA